MTTQLNLFTTNLAPLQASPVVLRWRRTNTETGREWWYDDPDEAEADRGWNETVSAVEVEVDDDDAPPDPPTA